jgi:hypothetical protein
MRRLSVWGMLWRKAIEPLTHCSAHDSPCAIRVCEKITNTVFVQQRRASLIRHRGALIGVLQ